MMAIRIQFELSSQVDGNFEAFLEGFERCDGDSKSVCLEFPGGTKFEAFLEGFEQCDGDSNSFRMEFPGGTKFKAFLEGFE